MAADCIVWNAPDRRHGYGRLAIGDVHWRAHRWVMALALGGGAIAGRDVRHTCDNPPCVNPDHLRAGTHAENMADKVAKGRQSRGESHGEAKLTDDAVLCIRRRRAAGEKLADIAADYGVSMQLIHQVANRKAWRHI